MFTWIPCDLNFFLCVLKMHFYLIRFSSFSIYFPDAAFRFIVNIKSECNRNVTALFRKIFSDAINLMKEFSLSFAFSSMINRQFKLQCVLSTFISMDAWFHVRQNKNKSSLFIKHRSPYNWNRQNSVHLYFFGS